MYVCMYVCMYIHTYIHRYRQTDKQTDRQTGRQTDRERQTDRQTDRETERQTDRQTDTVHFTIHLTVQLQLGVYSKKLILRSCQNVIKNSNIQRNDVMVKSFAQCIIDVISLVILIFNEKLLSPCLTKININKRGFSQT